MAIAVKRTAEFGIGAQTAAGTAAAAPDVYFPVTSANAEPAIVQYNPETIGDRQQLYAVQLGYDWTFSAEWDLHLTTGQIFEWLLGSTAQTGSGPVYTHTCDPVSTFDPDTGFVTVFLSSKVTRQGASTQTLRLVDACINSATIEIMPRAAAKISVDGMAGRHSEAADISGTYPANAPFVWDDLTFKIDDYAGTPASETDCEKITLQINNNFDYSRFLAGDPQPQPGVVGGLEVIVTLETTMQTDPFFWADVFGNQQKEMDFDLSKLLGGNTYKHQFIIKKAQPMGLTPAEIGGGNDRPVVSAEFRALKDGSNNALQVVVDDISSAW
jgi:hypothetical protein